MFEAPDPTIEAFWGPFLRGDGMGRFWEMGWEDGENWKTSS